MNLKPIVLILFWLPLRQLVNRIRRTRVDDALKFIALGGFVSGVLWAEYAFFQRFFELLGRTPMGFILVLPNAFSIMGSILFGFLAYSSVITALTSYYQSDDLRFLIASPAPLWTILLSRWFDVAFRTGATLFGLCLPPMIALGVKLNLGVGYYGAFLLSAAALTAAGVSAGVVASMAMMSIFPARRLHQTLSILGLCIAVAAIGGMRFLHLETLWSEDALANPLLVFLRQQPEGWMKYGPGSLFSRAMLPYVGFSNQRGGVEIAALVAGFSVAAALLTGRVLFMRGWWKAQQQADPQTRRGALLSERFWGRCLHRGPGLALMARDGLLLRRDPSIWTQLFMMIPLVAMYLVNLSFLPVRQSDFAPLMAVANVGLIALLVAVIGARFVFPSASREGRAVWIVAAAPASPWLRMVQQVLFSAPPALLVAIAMLYGSCLILHLTPAWTLWSMAAGGLITLQVIFLAAFLGFCFPMYNHRHLLEVSLGKGAFLYMAAAVLEIGGFLWFAIRFVLNHPADPPVAAPSVLAWLVLWAALTAAAAGFGVKRIRSYEWIA
ncbi:MAG: hypothetical protein GC154_05845 [bacterium]|nr:hypothetical protein [bacterium]